jgi:hypothetical protein
MARYSVETRLEPEAAIRKAVAYFGAEGLGLEAIEQNPCCFHFQGGGGHVAATAYKEGKKTILELETREWDRQVREFMRLVGRS